MSKRGIHAVVLAVGLGIGGAGCSSVPPPIAVPGPSGEVQIPAALMHEVQREWKGAVVGAGTASCQGGASGPPVAALKADVNGDRLDDYVIRLQQGGQARLYAALARGSGETDVVALTSDQGVPVGSVSIRKSGALFRRDGTIVDEWFTTDTVVVTGCDGRQTAFLWKGDGFESARLGDTTAAGK